MAAWPKSIISLGASILTSRTASRLRGHDRGDGAQRRIFSRLMRQLGAASFWREAGIRSGLTYETFRTSTIPRRYEALVAAIERMQAGEANILAPGHCAFFVSSSGTTGQMPKILPVTDPMMQHFHAACRDIVLYYTARVGHAGVLRGRHLQLTGSTALQPIGNRADYRSFVGNWLAVASLNFPGWVNSNLIEPSADVAALTDWQAKIDAIIAQATSRDISLIAGIPPWILSFAESIRGKRAEAGQPVETLQSIWPNLECLVYGGVPIAPYEAELRALLGASVNFHEVYAAAEGVFAIQDGAAHSGLRLLVDAGIFFEFLPFSDYDETRVEQLADRIIPLQEVKVGIDYVLIVTTPAGLVRYVLGDIVRFTSTEPPRLIYVGRTALQLNAVGEHVIEKQVTDALLVVCERHRWSIVNFHVAPLVSTDLTGQSRGRHEWWVELRPGTVETPTGPQMAVELDIELQRTNREYATRRRSGRIDSPIVRLVMPGVFRHWLRFRGSWGGQNKVARCRNDRMIADELAHLTRFAAD
jgi:hypothetical protein